jgi:hypothetical protein
MGINANSARLRSNTKSLRPHAPSICLKVVRPTCRSIHTISLCCTFFYDSGLKYLSIKKERNLVTSSTITAKIIVSIGYSKESIM